MIRLQQRTSPSFAFPITLKILQKAKAVVLIMGSYISYIFDMLPIRHMRVCRYELGILTKRSVDGHRFMILGACERARVCFIFGGSCGTVWRCIPPFRSHHEDAFELPHRCHARAKVCDQGRLIAALNALFTFRVSA